MKILLIPLLLLGLNANCQALELFSFNVSDKYFTNTSTACVQVQVIANAKYQPYNVSYNYSDDADKNRKSMGNFIMLEDSSGEYADVTVELTAVCGNIDTAEYKLAGYSTIKGYENYFFNDSSLIYVICPNMKNMNKGLVVVTDYKPLFEGFVPTNYNWFYDICNSIKIYNCCEVLE